METLGLLRLWDLVDFLGGDAGLGQVLGMWQWADIGEPWSLDSGVAPVGIPNF